VSAFQYRSYLSTNPLKAALRTQVKRFLKANTSSCGLTDIEGDRLYTSYIVIVMTSVTSLILLYIYITKLHTSKKCESATEVLTDTGDLQTPWKIVMVSHHRK
jgi:hypothetical protein